MHRSWLCSAIVLFAGVPVWAQSLPNPFVAQTQYGGSLPGQVVSQHVTLKANVVGDGFAATRAGGNCATCADPENCAPRRHVSWGDWLCFKSFRPGECTLTPTGYRPPLYTFFPCKGQNCQGVPDCSRCDPRFMQIGLPANAPVPIQRTAAQPPVAVPNSQGPLLPGSAAAAANAGVVTCSEPAPQRPVPSPYSIIQTTGRDEISTFRPIPVYVPSAPAKPIVP